MNLLAMQNFAQVSVERVVNSLPEGLLLALFVWLLLRLIGRQNSGTRFAVWFVTLIAVVALSVFGGFKLGEAHLLPIAPHFNSHFTISTVWAELIFALWMLATAVALVRIAIGLWQICAIRKSCIEIELSLLPPATANIFQSHSSNTPVRLAVSERIKIPGAIGFWKPIIVVPTWASQELKQGELNPVLIHELTHLQRHDDWTNLLQKIARAVFFFHPAVWWIDSQLSLEREMACDDAVLANTGNPRAYASSLIGILERSCARRGWTMAQAAVRRTHELSLRIAQILDVKRPTTTRVWKPALALTSIFSLVCFALSLCAPRLIAFAPETSDSSAATRMADIKAALHTNEEAMPNVQMVPASFHVPSSVPQTQHLTPTHRPVKRHSAEPAETRLTSQFEQQQKAPRVVMAKAIASTTKKNVAPRTQMVVFVETTYIRFAQLDDDQDQQRNIPMWRTQVLQILLMTPTQNAQQMEIGSSTI